LRAFFSIDVVFDVWVPTLACSHRVQQLMLGAADWTGRIWAALLTGPGIAAHAIIVTVHSVCESVCICAWMTQQHLDDSPLLPVSSLAQVTDFD
jgi:hypothetical protein